MSVFDPVARDYDTFRPAYPAALFDCIEQYAGALRGRRVLDVAAGTGIATRALAERGAVVVASDIGVEMLRVLRHRSRDVAVVRARAEALPFGSATAELVTCATAWHWVDPDEGPREVRRVLAPHGVLAVWWGFGALAPEDEAAAEAEREVYARWRVNERAVVTPSNTEDPVEQLRARGFVDVVTHDLGELRTRPVADHVSQLMTQSPVISLGADAERVRQDLLAIFAGRDEVTERVGCRLTLARRS